MKIKLCTKEHNFVQDWESWGLDVLYQMVEISNSVSSSTFYCFVLWKEDNFKLMKLKIHMGIWSLVFHTRSVSIPNLVWCWTNGNIEKGFVHFNFYILFGCSENYNIYFSLENKMGLAHLRIRTKRAFIHTQLHLFHFCFLQKNGCNCLFYISGFNVVKYTTIF